MRILSFLDENFVEKIKEIEKAGDLGETLLYARFESDVIAKAVNKGQLADNEIKFIISDRTIDRYQDAINPQGWNLKNFKKNPIVLWDHNLREDKPPIASARDTRYEESIDKLTSIAVFLDPDNIADTAVLDSAHYRFSRTILHMLKTKILNTVSVGFIPREIKYLEGKEQEKRPLGLDIEKQELVEYSVTPIPANPNALAQIRTIKGFDALPIKNWIEKAIDEHNFLTIPRKELEVGYKALSDVVVQNPINIGKTKEKRKMEFNEFEESLNRSLETFDEKIKTVIEKLEEVKKSLSDQELGEHDIIISCVDEAEQKHYLKKLGVE